MTLELLFGAVRGFAVNVPTEELGINGLNWIREGIGIGITSERVRGEVLGLHQDVLYKTIPEHIEKEFKHFQHSELIDVEVPDGFLNRFVYRQMVIESNPETGEILYIRADLKISTDKILTAWKSAGYHLNWK